MTATSHLDGAFWNFIRRSKHSVVGALRQRRRRRFIGRIIQTTGMRVFDGPFAGMLVGSDHIYGAPFAKLLGTYEKELHPHVRHIIDQMPRTVIDVGGAEGYYAIGMALRKQIEAVLVWESLSAGRNIIQQRAEANGVSEKVDVRGKCREPILHKAIVSRSAGTLIMDVEGAELDLLSSRVCEALRDWSLIVEGHDFVRPGCTSELVGRLELSHRIAKVESKVRTVEDFPLDLNATDSLKTWVMNEGRPGVMHWVVGYPRVPTAGIA